MPQGGRNVKIVVYGPDKRVGVIRDRDSTVVDAARAASAPSDLAKFIAGGKAVLDATRAAVDKATDSVPLSSVKLHAPCPAGAKIACAGGNFADHAGLMFAKRNKKPFTPDMVAAFADEIRKNGIWGFWKISAPMANDEEIVYPARAKRLDYEGELAIILSKPARDVRVADFRNYVWGVTLMSDWSIRDVNEGGPLKFGMQKNFDTSVSLGPCIVVGEIDPTNAPVETLVNGQRRQSYNTKDMVFSFGEYLEYLSRDLTLQPGDVITGGTAKGTAADSSALLSDGSSAPELFLKPGDVVEVRSPGLGTLRNRIVAKAL
jgi:2-keto-4-pentenoate hydratase/2-oxohepta-3-ene-1,7-dioic acid hydratase in catechol pathway